MKGILPVDLELLKHALGVRPEVKPKNWGYRNRYVVGGSGPALNSMLRLAGAGLVVKSDRDDRVFHATAAGCELVGLTERQVKEAAVGGMFGPAPTWRTYARPIIAKVISEVGRADEKALRLALCKAYPFGQKSGWPYEVWRTEIKRQLAEPRPIEHPEEQENLFEPGAAQ